MKLLISLYETHSPSHHEEPMRALITDWLSRHVKGATVVKDDAGNLLVTKGESDSYPCIVAHMDQVQRSYPASYAVSPGPVITAIDRATRRQCGLGADDKNGIWIALNALKKYPVMKCAFFVAEEVGMVGSRDVDMTFFADCRWVVQCDRVGHNDFITFTNGVEICDKTFYKACHAAQHKYDKGTGTATDVGILKKRGLKVCAVNLSCGYYNPHSDMEYTVMHDLLKCQRLVEYMVEHLTGIYPHTQPVPKPKRIKEDHSLDYNARAWGSYYKPTYTSNEAENMIISMMNRCSESYFQLTDDDLREEVDSLLAYYERASNIEGKVDEEKLTQTIIDMAHEWQKRHHENQPPRRIYKGIVDEML